MLNVAFTDDTETVICSYFSCPQDPVFYPDQGQVETNDPRWKVFYDSQTNPYIPNSLPAPDTASVGIGGN